MDLDDLDLRDLLATTVRGGMHFFASRRVLLLQTGALWAMRQQLTHNIGTVSARTVLSQLGCAWGWETADAADVAVPWNAPELWPRALSRLQALVGLGSAGVTPQAIATERRWLDWSDSFEAQHFLLQEERSQTPVCWLLEGFASGYLSRSMNELITCREERCVAMGAPACHFVLSHAEAVNSAREVAGCLDILKQLRDRPQPAAVLPGEVDTLTAVVEGDGQRLGAHSLAMRHVLDFANRVAPLDSTVVLVGESGVGKERLAQFIHERSRRSKNPFVAINCGALSDSLLESELFGHGRGAFTGAVHERPGLFEAATGGTLFLDEIGEMPLNMQVKLLRVLQEREVRRLGENKPRRIDVRVIVATNRELGQEVMAKRFRHDLYYRLRVVEIRIPPLRERPEDLRVLIRILLDRAIGGVPCAASGFTPRALDVLLRYHWPGNVRELENAIERACVVARGPFIDVRDLPEHVQQGTPVPGSEVIRPLHEVEREYVLSVLAMNRGNRTRTAEQLEIAPATLHRKLSHYARMQLLPESPNTRQRPLRPRE